MSVFTNLDFFKHNMDMTDWRTGQTCMERYMHMFENQIGCDVTFSLEDDKKIEAHKFILVSGSAVFEAMFCGFLTEKNVNKVIK